MRLRHSVLLLALLAGACAGESAGQLFVTPGRFDYLTCRDIARATEAAQRREEELKILIERAEKDAFGSLVATASYRGEYLRAQTEQQMLAEVGQRKHCAPEPPGAPPPLPSPGRRR
jgi:hypothetical protein